MHNGRGVKTLYLDTEFNGFGGELISLALVPEDNPFIRSFYGVVTLPPEIHPWVAENVIPALMLEPEELELFQFRMSVWLTQFEAVRIIADWPDDIAYFCRALITGPGERMKTPDLSFEIRPDLSSERSLLPHNALEDAHAIRRMAEQLMRETVDG